MKFQVTEIVKYEVEADNHKHACQLIEDNANREDWCPGIVVVGMFDRYAEPLDSDGNVLEQKRT